MADTSNAKRFIEAYNKIDHSLRVQYNLKRGQTFSDCIRRCASLNSIVRKFEDTLIDYGRLRNAIIHRSDDYIIAEPHTIVVEHIEKIAELISTPPLAINSVCRKDVLTVQSNVDIKSVVKLMAESGYSNIPVYKDLSLIGLANGQKIMDVLGKQLIKGINLEEFISSTMIGDVIPTMVSSNFYAVANAKLTIEESLNMFYTNRKLLAILLTKTGNFMEPVLGIITVGDIIDLNNILESYE